MRHPCAAGGPKSSKLAILFTFAAFAAACDDADAIEARVQAGADAEDDSLDEGADADAATDDDGQHEPHAGDLASTNPHSAANCPLDRDKDGYRRNVNDCNDNKAGIHPGAVDHWYDGVDSDCAGNNDFDADADGYALGDDCNDNDAGINPAAAETCGDLIDQDCDGSDATCPDGCVVDTPAATGPELLTAASFAVLGGATVTNTGSSVLGGDLGVSPGTEITGFPPGFVAGTTHTNDATAVQAQVDLTAAFTDAATRSGSTPLPADISGMTLAPGVYSASSSLQIASDDLTLDGGGDPNATWIFQIGTSLVTSSGVDVILTETGCADAGNVFWVVGSSATIGSGTDFVGTIMADQSITAVTGMTINGRLLARIGAVTLDTNIVDVP